MTGSYYYGVGVLRRYLVKAFLGVGFRMYRVLGGLF